MELYNIEPEWRAKLRNAKFWILHNLHPRTISNRLMGRCRVCGSGKDVLMYDSRSLLYYFVRKTYCPEHCPDHDYVYDRYEGHYCNNCGQSPDPDWYAERFD